MHKDIIIVGAGHYGLIAAYYLKDKADVIVLEQNNLVGDNWRSRFDSMQLFTPSFLASLPDLPMALEKDARPNKTHMGDYLDRYVDHFAIPVFNNHKVLEVTKDNGVFKVQSDKNLFTCDQLILAHGNLQAPIVPTWVNNLAIPAIHFRKYRNPVSVKGKRVLVSGEGNSAAQIAGELSKYFDVSWAKGKKQPTSGLTLLGKNRFWWSEKLKQKEVSDQKINPIFYADQLSQKLKRVTKLPTVKEANGNKVTFSNGTVKEFDFVVYSEGFNPDYSFINIEGFKPNIDRLRELKGGSDIENLFFAGVPYQRARFPFVTKWQVKDVQSLIDLIKKR